ncbi:hypothetical protein OSG_eHP35_00125 [environmental Halophage eHP-35]|nr:hypothetical protein OSG_eHP35_00125 [environmental Halophage eHP-35]
MPEGPVQQNQPADTQTGAVYRQGQNTETLSGDKTLSSTDEQIQVLDAGGAGRNIDLPADEEGLYFEIYNKSDAAEDLTVRDADTNTVVVVSQNESAVVRNTGNGYVSRLSNVSTSQEV